MNLIAGVTLIRSIKGAHFMHQLPGVEVPDKIFQRLEQAKDIKKESYQLCLETIEKIKSLTGVQGIHLMAINNTDTIKQLILDSNLRGIN
jgi:5,10-methylenetetrahydrofolate reductase